MSVAAAVVQYRKEFVGLFEQQVSQLRACTTREAVIKGNQATFLVSGSAGDTAVTRGTNGQIPYKTAQNNQYTATLVEKHAAYEMTGFNIFASQGDQVAIMRRSSMAVINRDIDQVIISELDNASTNTGAAQTASLSLVMQAMAILGKNDVPTEDENNLFAVVTPAFRAYLMQTSEFANGDYVNTKPFAGAAVKFWRWAGVNWFVSTRLTGMGTASENCYMFHRDAIGHAVNVGEESINIGYEDKQDTSWSRATIFHGAKILQNNGIVQMVHDGSAF